MLPIDVEQAYFGLKCPVEEGQLRTNLVVPVVFGVVSRQVFRGRRQVIAARFIAGCYRSIHHFVGREVLTERELRRNPTEMHVVFERSRQHLAVHSRCQRVFISLIILAHALVIVAQSHGSMQALRKVIGGLMIEGTAPSGVVIELRCGEFRRQELCFDHVVELLIEAECPNNPVIAAVVARRTQRELLTGEALFQRSDSKEEVDRHEVLVDVLPVFAVLKGRLAVEAEALAAVEPVHSAREQVASVVAPAIIADRSDPVCHHIIGTIGVTALQRVVEDEAHAHRPAVSRPPSKAQSGARGVAVIGLLAKGSIIEKAVVVMVIARYREAETLVQLRIMTQSELHIVARSVANSGHSVLVIQRRMGRNIDESARRIASVERALWPTKHLNPTDSGKLHVENRAVEIGHSVDVKSHGRRVNLRTYAANIDGRVLPCPVVGHEEVGKHRAHLAQSAQFVVLNEAASGCRNRHRRIFHVVLFEPRHDHFAQFVPACDGRVGFRCTCGRRKAYPE